MKKIKILHLADYHLGLKPIHLGKLAEDRSVELLKSFKDICQLANDENIDAMLIAGDFIEQSDIGDSYFKAILNLLSTIKAKVFIVAGNHDYISIGSRYLEEFPNNVHIFKDDKIETVYLKEFDTYIHGVSFRSSYQRESILDQSKKIDQEAINIFLLHGDITNESSLYNPISNYHLNTLNAEYLALGHIHKASGILKKGNTYYAYPGSPIGQGFDELGPKGVIIGEISKEKTELRQFIIKAPMFLEESFDVSKYETENEIANALKATLLDKYENLDNYFRVNLEGYVQEYNRLDLSVLQFELSDLKYLEILDNTKMKIDYETARDESSLKGVFINNVLLEKERSIKDSDLEKTRMLDRVLELGLRAMEGRKL